MLGLIFAVIGIIIIAAAFVPAWLSSENNTGGSPTPKTVGGGCLAVIVGILVILFGFGFAEVPAGHVGVVTSFGKIHEQTLAPGLAWMPPFVNTVTLMDGRVQVYAFENVEGASSDLQTAQLSGNINFHIDPAAAATLYQTVGVDYKDKVFVRPADTILKSVTPRYRAIDIVSRRVELGVLTRDALNTEVARYGIVVDSVNIANIGLSAEFLASVEAKVRAEQEAARERELIEVAEAQAAQTIARANGDATAQVTRANGEAEANRVLAESLSEEILRYLYVTTLNPEVEIIYLPTDGEFLLPLPQGQPSVPTAPNAPVPPTPAP